MNIIIILSALWVIHLSTENTQLNLGMDERPILQYDDDKEILYTIQKHNNNIQLLEKLQSHISIQEKIDEIQKIDLTPSYKRIHVKSGGLMKDWDFEDFS